MSDRDLLDDSNSGGSFVLAKESSRSISTAQSFAKSLREIGNVTIVASRYIAESTAYSTTNSIGRALDTATGTSKLVHGLRVLNRWVTASFLYRWLTSEPDTSVIVIDLRETKTVGPFLVLLENPVDAVSPSIQRSAFLKRLNAWGDTVREAPVRVLSLIVLVATLVNLGVQVFTSGFDPVITAFYVLIIGVAAIGTQVRFSWAEHLEFRPARFVAQVYTPPELEEPGAEDADRGRE